MEEWPVEIRDRAPAVAWPWRRRARRFGEDAHRNQALFGGSVSEEARAIRGPGPAATSGTQLHQLAGRRWNKGVCSVSRLAKKLGRQAVFGDAGPKSRNSAQNHACRGRQGRFGGLCLQAVRHDRPQPESAGAVWLFEACFRIPFAFPTVSERSDCGRRRCVSPTTNVEL